MTGLTNADTSQGDNRDGCPLCKIVQREVLEEYPRWRLARTKTMKGHRERLMLFHREHLKTLDEQSIGEAYLLLMESAPDFSHTLRSGQSSNPYTRQYRTIGTE